MNTPNPNHPPRINAPEQHMFAVRHPTGLISLRTLHTSPMITIQKSEEDHGQDWQDLHAAGYRLISVTLTVTAVHEDVYETIYHYQQGKNPNETAPKA